MSQASEDTALDNTLRLRIPCLQRCPDLQDQGAHLRELDALLIRQQQASHLLCLPDRISDPARQPPRPSARRMTLDLPAGIADAQSQGGGRNRRGNSGGTPLQMHLPGTRHYHAPMSFSNSSVSQTLPCSCLQSGARTSVQLLWPRCRSVGAIGGRTFDFSIARMLCEAENVWLVSPGACMSWKYWSAPCLRSMSVEYLELLCFVAF